MARSSTPPEKPPPDTLSVELGHWFKARATGRGVIAIPVVIVVVAGLVIAQAYLG